MSSKIRALSLWKVYRDREWELRFAGEHGDDSNGCFKVPSPVDHASMAVLVSSGDGWDHVSVSRPNRCPNWTEMDRVKRMFFHDDAVCMQLHVAAKDHISIHPNCLHIWRPHDVEIPLPPSIMVGPDVMPKEDAREFAKKVLRALT